MNRPLEDLHPGTVLAPSIQQHEEQVLEIAVQLMHVCHVAKSLSLFPHIDVLQPTDVALFCRQFFVSMIMAILHIWMSQAATSCCAEKGMKHGISSGC